MSVSGAAIEAGRAVVRFMADDSALRNSLQAMSVELKTWGSRISGLGRSMMIAGAAGASLFIKPIMEASRTEQLMGRFAAVFDTAAASAGRFADNLAKDINKSGLEIRDMMAQFQVMLKGVGFDNSKATQMSQQLTSLTNDWIAFDDTIVNGQEAMDLFRSAMAGETEPARKMGADLRVTTMNAEFLAKGIKNASTSISEMERMQWRYNKIAQALERSGVVGQAGREVNMAASLVRGFKAMLRDLSNAIGQELLPTFSAWTKSVIAVGRELESMVRSGKSMIPFLAELTIKVAATGVALLVFGKALEYSAKAMAAFRLVAGVKMLASTPYTAIPLAIGAAFAGLLFSINAATAGAEKTKAAFSNLFKGIADGASAAGKAMALGEFGMAADMAGGSLRKMWAQFKLDLPNIRGYFEWIEKLVQAFRNLADAVQQKFRIKWLEELVGYDPDKLIATGTESDAELKKTIAFENMRISLLNDRLRILQRIAEIEKQERDAARAEKNKKFDPAAAFGQRNDVLGAFLGWKTPFAPNVKDSTFAGVLDPYMRVGQDRLDSLMKLWRTAVYRGTGLALDYKKVEREELVRRNRMSGGILGQLENAFWRMGLEKSSPLSARAGFGSTAMLGEFQFGESLGVEKEQLITQKKMEELLFGIGKKVGSIIAGSK